MTDLNKRRTMKFLSAAPLVTMPALASLSHAEVVDNAHSAKPDLPAARQRTGMPLEIQIINTTAVLDNNVVFRNASEEQLVISRFMPGHIVFDNHMMDLNAAVDQRTLALEPGESKSFTFALLAASTRNTVEYVWAEHAVAVLSDETSVITLSAFMADTNAVVYANTRQYIPS